ncbi:MAG TPA: pyridoxamine 5'-phosphate oxidase family protein [Nitriliruptorales bacterium]|nr:pyridoxamine 5'-phosphate oxidase family protein [Nitriliruptorales bacterium]
MSVAVALDRGLEVLDTGQCLRLLGSVAVGRIAVDADGGPTVLPVNYVVDEWTIVVRTTFGAKLVAAALERPVAFEVDDFDAATRTGWSVLVKGTAEVVTSAEVIDRLQDLGLDTWAEGVTRDRWVRIHPNQITGRRIPPLTRPPSEPGPPNNAVML